jgi:hypothetical protein
MKPRLESDEGSYKMPAAHAQTDDIADAPRYQLANSSHHLALLVGTWLIWNLLKLL